MSTLIILLILAILSSCSLDGSVEKRVNLVTVALDYDSFDVNDLFGTLNDRSAFEEQIAFLCAEEGTELRCMNFIQEGERWYSEEIVRSPGKAPLRSEREIGKEDFRRSISAFLSSLSSDTRENDLNIFYYAGHGVDAGEEESAFLPLRGALVLGEVDLSIRPEWREDEGNLSYLMTTEELRDHMAVLQGRSLIIMDSCYSGEVVTADGGVVPMGDIGAAFSSFTATGGGGREIFELSASRHDELSYESDEGTELYHGRFSKALVEALGYVFHEENGEYPGVPNEKVITLSALWKECQKALEGTRQTPQNTRSIEDIVLFTL